MFEPIIVCSPRGSSRVAEWLVEAGVDMGSRFNGGDPPLQDRYFVDFTELLLDEEWKVAGDEPNLTPVQFRTGIEKVFIDKRAALKPWGWNDPHTAQVLPLIKEYFPNAYYIVVEGDAPMGPLEKKRQELIQEHLLRCPPANIHVSRAFEYEPSYVYHASTRANVQRLVDLQKKEGTDKKPNVFVSVPCLGWVHYSVLVSLLRVRLDTRVDVTCSISTWRPYSHNLNKSVQNFLKHEQFDYWLNMDADNASRKNPFDLVFLDKDVVALATPIWKDQGDGPVVHLSGLDRPGPERKFSPHQCIEEGIREVDGIGSGCVLVARRVLEKLKAPFCREWDEDGLVKLGGDYAFSIKAKDAGFKIWCHFGYPCTHYKEMEIKKTLDACYRQYVTEPSDEKKKAEERYRQSLSEDGILLDSIEDAGFTVGPASEHEIKGKVD